MKFSAITLLVASASAAFTTEQEVETRLGQIIEKNRLLKQKGELIEQLSTIDASITQLEDTPAKAADAKVVEPTLEQLQAALDLINKLVETNKKAYDDAVTAKKDDATLKTLKTTWEASVKAQTIAQKLVDDKSGSNAGLIIGGVVVGAILIGGGFFLWKKRQGSEDHEGGSKDDLYSKFISEELSA